MGSLDIKLSDNRTAFKPCEKISGRAEWQLENNPEALELSLFWQTEGKGTKDSGIAETIRFDNPGSVGSRIFSLRLPSGPYSFSGKLISIIWNLELAEAKGKDAIQKSIIISPTEKEIVCTDLISDSEEEGHKNSFLKFTGKFKFSSHRF